MVLKILTFLLLTTKDKKLFLSFVGVLTKTIVLIMDISELCRACMKEVISWEKGNFNFTTEMFVFCTNIPVSEDDELPKQFCYNCCINIESSYNFIKEAKKADITLRNIVFRSETSVIVETESLSKFYHTQSQEMAPKEIITSNDNVQSQNDNILDMVNFLDKQMGTEDSNKPVSCQNKDIICDTVSNTEITDDIKNKIIGETSTKRSGQHKKDSHNIKLNICPICRKKFSSETWFSKHMHNEHANNKFICKHCSKGFTKSYLLKQHMLIHSDKRPFTCEVCSKGYKQRKQLNTHMKTHYDARPYSCHHCNMSFKLKSILVVHLKLHEKDKPHLCFLCGATFTQAGNLAVHMRTHSGEKPYRCAQCGFVCAAASSLRRHRLRHGAARRHRCDTCHKRFHDAAGLQRHTRVHSGEAPYRCPLCAHCFTDSWKRKSHMMRQHRLRLADIPRMDRDGQRL